jgi:NAD-dependent deacetylase
VVITQNIDRLHHVAGSRDIIALHGDMFAYRCDRNCQGDPTPVDLNALTWDEENAPPRCPYCEKGQVRPDVVWFGEYLQRANVERAICETEQCDAMIVIGTYGAIPLSQHLPALARQKGAFVIEVNPAISQITPLVNLHLAAPSGEIMPQVVAALRAQKAGGAA